MQIHLSLGKTKGIGEAKRKQEAKK